MYTNTLPWYMASMFAIITLFFGLVSFAQAAQISQTDIEAQKTEVVQSITKALEQQLMLVQMLFIQKLEVRIAQLQALADDR